MGEEKNAKIRDKERERENKKKTLFRIKCFNKEIEKKGVLSKLGLINKLENKNCYFGKRKHEIIN